MLDAPALANFGKTWCFLTRSTQESVSDGGSNRAHTQRIEYYDGSTKVAAVHQYLQPDGTLGASQIPDPKELLVDDEIWIV